LLRFWGPRFAALRLEREEPLLEREALLRLVVDAEDLERGEPLKDRDEPLRDAPPPEREDPLASVFEPEPFDDRLLLCLMREVDSLLAIRHPSPIENVLFLARLPAVLGQ
jgi:hypothetical protein